jgi:Ca-activated chloride channel family protein
MKAVARMLTRLAVAGLALALLTLAAAGEAATKAQKQAIAELPQRYQDWLVTVDLLITDEELTAFLELDKDYQRDAFIVQFWRQRDPYPSTSRNEFRDRWERRLQAAQYEFGDLERDDRARILLLNDMPAGRSTVRCAPLWPIEVWFYRADQPGGPGFDMLLIFYQRFNDGPYRIWEPADGVGTLTRFFSVLASPQEVFAEIRSSCVDSDDIIGALSYIARKGQMQFGMELAEVTQPKSEPNSAEWTATFNSFSTDLPEGAQTFPAKLELGFPGRFQTRTVVQGSLLVDPDDVDTAELGGANTYNFVLTGEVLLGDALFDSFHYQFNIPSEELQTEKLPLLFERKLRPGDYQLILKLEDLNSKKVHRVLEQIEVPYVEGRMPVQPDDPETARMLAEANAAIYSGDNIVQIVPPTGNLLAGLVRFNTQVTGPDIAEVEFSFDGKSLFRKRTPPYSVELDLGNLPRMRTLSAVARDAEGNEVARDELVLNSGSHRFEVRLREPRKGRTYKGSLRAVADVLVPEGRSIERVEFYLNEQLVAALYQPPWEQPILLPPGQEVGYVRAVAYQPDGASVEEVVFINAPDFLEDLDVNFVPLYVAVVDKEKRPVLGLEESDFRVLEDGVLQTPVRFDLVSNLPIHAGLVVDVSASMEENLDTAKQAALGFVEEVIDQRDRATLITFNDHPNLTVKFTNELKEIAGGLAGLKAERGTALFDSIIFSLYYFNGVKGQRALVILSDGKDESSRFSYDNTLEYARRSGVAIYAIGLAYKKADRADRKKLNEIAVETGGRAFFIESVDELPGIYATIQEELRSRYYLGYQSTNTADDDVFRLIEVEIVDRAGLEAKTKRGYYP